MRRMRAWNEPANISCMDLDLQFEELDRLQKDQQKCASQSAGLKPIERYHLQVCAPSPSGWHP